MIAVFGIFAVLIYVIDTIQIESYLYSCSYFYHSYPDMAVISHVSHIARRPM